MKNVEEEMKKYMVTITRNQVTSMMVNGNSRDEVKTKIADLMKSCEKSDIALRKIFDKPADFKYKVKYIEDKTN